MCVYEIKYSWETNILQKYPSRDSVRNQMSLNVPLFYKFNFRIKYLKN